MRGWQPFSKAAKLSRRPGGFAFSPYAPSSSAAQKGIRRGCRTGGENPVKPGKSPQFDHGSICPRGLGFDSFLDSVRADSKAASQVTTSGFASSLRAACRPHGFVGCRTDVPSLGEKAPGPTSAGYTRAGSPSMLFFDGVDD